MPPLLDYSQDYMLMIARPSLENENPPFPIHPLPATTSFSAPLQNKGLSLLPLFKFFIYILSSVPLSCASFSLPPWRLLSSRLLKTLEIAKSKDSSPNLFSLGLSAAFNKHEHYLQDTPFSWFSFYLATPFSISFSGSIVFFCSSTVEGKDKEIGKERKQIQWCMMDLASLWESSMTDCFISQDRLPRVHMNDCISGLAVQWEEEGGIYLLAPIPHWPKVYSTGITSSSLPS